MTGGWQCVWQQINWPCPHFRWNTLVILDTGITSAALFCFPGLHTVAVKGSTSDDQNEEVSLYACELVSWSGFSKNEPEVIFSMHAGQKRVWITMSCMPHPGWTNAFTILVYCMYSSTVENFKLRPLILPPFRFLEERCSSIRKAGGLDPILQLST